MMSPSPVELSRTLSTRLRSQNEHGGEKAFVDAIVSQMKTDRLFWVLAREDQGGQGLSIHDAARITFNVSRLSGSAGLIYAMHLSQALTVIRHSSGSAFFADFVARMVRDQSLIASGTSEKGIGGDILQSICTIEDVGNGSLIVSKESPNISYIDHAGAILVTAMQRTGDRKQQVLIAAESTRTEFRAGRAMNLLGMRGILNSPYTVTSRFESEAIFPEPYAAIARTTMTPSIHIFWAAMWSGMASNALTKAKLYLAKESAGEAGIDSVMHSELSRLVNKHYTMNALIRSALAEFSDPINPSALGLMHTAHVKRLKVVCSELLEEICLDLLALVGMRGYAEEGPYSLAQIVRDALSARIMISNYRLLTTNAKIERFVDETL